MSTVAETAASAVAGVTSSPREWSVADLCDRFGPILFKRIRHDPEPGTATEADVVRLDVHFDRLCELVDGVLIQKTGDMLGSVIAVRVASSLNQHAPARKAGFVLGTAGAWRIRPGLVRIPDVAWYAWDDMPGRRAPKVEMMSVAPRLIVEVLSPENTTREIDYKLDDYFRAGVRLVWLIDPSTLSAQVLIDRGRVATFDVSQSLDGGTVLPGFSLPLATLFEDFEYSEAEETPAP